MTEKKWQLKRKTKLTNKKSDEEIIKLFLKLRGVSEKERKSFLQPKHPLKLTNRDWGIKTDLLKKAVKLIEGVGREKTILIYGDYDADGLCATAILWEALYQAGYKKAVPFIPHREEDGYGLKKEVLEKLVKKYPNLGLVITVDNGIIAHEGAEYCQEIGIPLIITDHHLAGKKKPFAEVIIHSTKVAGAGLAWLLGNQFGYSDLDLVSIGTIADLVPLKGVSRSLVKYGLKHLEKTERKGLRALKRKVGLNPGEEIVPWQISFLIAPRLNAVTRLADGMDVLRFLCTSKIARARKLTDYLEKVNSKRRQMTLDNLEIAKSGVEEKKDILVVEDKEYHPGIIGLVAARLVDDFGKPAVVIARNGELSRGSARSIGSFDITAFLKKAAHLLVDLGGHSGAAGFTIEAKNISKFKKEVEKLAVKELKGEDLVPSIEVDSPIDFSLLTKRFCNLLDKLSPFGAENERPVFLIEKAKVVGLRKLGKDGSHLRLMVDDPQSKPVERMPAEAIGFGWGEMGGQLSPGDLVDLVFTLEINRWRGQEKVQMKIKDLRKSS